MILKKNRFPYWGMNYSAGKLQFKPQQNIYEDNFDKLLVFNGTIAYGYCTTTISNYSVLLASFAKSAD